MNKVFSQPSLSGIIQPGHLYIFSERPDRGWPPEPIEYLFCITNDEELAQALEMEFCVVLVENYEVIKFLGVRQLDDDCHEFTVLCNDREEGSQVTLELYLHRIQSFSEYLTQTKWLFRE